MNIIVYAHVEAGNWVSTLAARFFGNRIDRLRDGTHCRSPPVPLSSCDLQFPAPLLASPPFTPAGSLPHDSTVPVIAAPGALPPRGSPFPSSATPGNTPEYRGVSVDTWSPFCRPRPPSDRRRDQLDPALAHPHPWLNRGQLVRTLDETAKELCSCCHIIKCIPGGFQKKRIFLTADPGKNRTAP